MSIMNETHQYNTATTVSSGSDIPNDTLDVVGVMLLGALLMLVWALFEHKKE